MVARYDSLADRTIFTQGDPFTVSPDMHCLLNQTAAFAAVQVLSWVQQAKRKMELFSRCRASYLGGCRGLPSDPLDPLRLPHHVTTVRLPCATPP